MKDPAFLFYSSDFFQGCLMLDNAEVGIYIRLLCIQHQHGKIPKTRLGLLVGCFWDEFSDELKSKFIEDENGAIFNVRLETEIENRRYYAEKQRENGKKGGAPKGNQNAKKQPKNNPKTTRNTTQKQALENENENVNTNEDIEKGGMGEKTEIAEIGIFDELNFEHVWDLFGRKGNRKTSERKWNGLPKKTKQIAVVHIPQYVESTPVLKYRKNFETYIGQEVWLDEIISENGTNQSFSKNGHGGLTDEEAFATVECGLGLAAAAANGKWT